MTSAVTLTRWETDSSVHEMVTRRGAGAAAELVSRYAGYDELATLHTRREVANTGVSLILAFGDPLGIAYDESEEPRALNAFVVGIQTRAALTTFSGRQRGVQVDLTVRGTHNVLGVPPDELADMVVPLESVLGKQGEQLLERLEASSSWADRFALLDEVIGATLDSRAGPDAEVAWLLRQLVGAHGSTRVEPLMDETGRSQRYLTERFRRQVGVTPKTYARLLRFERTLELLRGRARDAPLGGIAATVGYYDQAHFDREFRSFAGCTPTEFLRESDPSPTVSFVQDIAG